MALQRSVKLVSGAHMPLVGLGTWQSGPNEVKPAIRTALETGYKHFDFAALYGNEKEIGEVLGEWFKDPNHKREEYFFTSKVWNSNHHPDKIQQSCEKSLSDLQLKYLDLYLIHWPISQGSDGKNELIPDIVTTWGGMEKLVANGKVKHIGVSNWPVHLLKQHLPLLKTKPAVNQVELHPYLPQPELVKFCKENNIVVTAYSPLGSTGSPAVRDDPTVAEIAKRLNKTTAQVLISYHASRDIPVIPKSTSPERIKSNFQDFVLSKEDIALLDQLHLKSLKRYCPPSQFFGIKLFDDEK